MAASGSIFGGGSAGGPAGAAVSAGTQYGQNFDQGLWGLFHSLFNKNEDPYKKGFEATQPYFNQAVGQQNPFAKQGEQAIGANQDWLNQMKDPQEFIKHIMSGYQESPWARNQQNASMRAGTNAASASGLTGSTPFAQQLQQNANRSEERRV